MQVADQSGFLDIQEAVLVTTLEPATPYILVSHASSHPPSLNQPQMTPAVAQKSNQQHVLVSRPVTFKHQHHGHQLSVMPVALVASVIRFKVRLQVMFNPLGS